MTVPWREVITSSLPPRVGEAGDPGDDGPNPDPRAIYDDIVDELSDHLDCAMRREQQRGHDEAVAQTRVLARFGDPARIAKQLWFDAMKESIMSKRVSIVTNILLGVMVLVLGIAVVMLMLRQERTMAIVAQQMVENRALMEQIAADGRDSTVSDPGWVPVTVLLERALDSDATAFAVSISGEPFSAGKRDQLQESDVTDSVKFGPIRPGKYELMLTHSEGWQNRRVITVYPGSEHSVTVQAPGFHDATVPISLDISGNRSANLDLVAAHLVVDETIGPDRDSARTWRRTRGVFALPDGSVFVPETHIPIQETGRRQGVSGITVDVGDELTAEAVAGVPVVQGADIRLTLQDVYVRPTRARDDGQRPVVQMSGGGGRHSLLIHGRFTTDTKVWPIDFGEGKMERISRHLDGFLDAPVIPR